MCVALSSSGCAQIARPRLRFPSNRILAQEHKESQYSQCYFMLFQTQRRTHKDTSCAVKCTSKPGKSSCGVRARAPRVRQRRSYPTEAERRSFVVEGGIMDRQVMNRSSNARKRHWKVRRLPCVPLAVAQSWTRMGGRS